MTSRFIQRKNYTLDIEATDMISVIRHASVGENITTSILT